MIRARFEFKLQDMWIGVFWKSSTEKYIPDGGSTLDDMMAANRTDIWICLIPTIPLHVVIRTNERPHDDLDDLLLEGVDANAD